MSRTIGTGRSGTPARGRGDRVDGRSKAARYHTEAEGVSNILLGFEEFGHHRGPLRESGQ